MRRGDVKKGDGTHRSRLVAKEIKSYNAPELVAATLSRESLKCLMRRAAQDKDIARAYCYASASRGICDSLPVSSQARV